jgi:hypothetical protein
VFQETQQGYDEMMINDRHISNKMMIVVMVDGVEH